MSCARARLSALLLAGAGCATLWKAGLRPADGGRPCPGALVSSAAISDGLHLRADVRVLAAPMEWGLTLAAQKVRGRLVVVGLDGFGAKLFSIVQDGTELEVERSFGRELPWPPENLLRDLHRARFGAPPGDRVSIERSAPEPGRTRVVIHNAECRYDAVFVLTEDPATEVDSPLRPGTGSPR